MTETDTSSDPRCTTVHLVRVAQEMEITPGELLSIWNAELPHFGGVAPHRYEFDCGYNEACCVYCGRPREYVPPSK